MQNLPPVTRTLAFIWALWGLVVLGLTGAAFAQAPASERVLHEYIAPSFWEVASSRAGESTLVGEGEMPEAIERDGVRLDAPTAGEEAVLGADRAGGIPRPQEARPDRDTTEDGALRYRALFNPTVAPLRRNVVFDVVSSDYRWTVANTPRRPVPVIGRRVEPGRELFWGSVSVELSGTDAPLPSVAPDMRILALETDPPTSVVVVRDGGDNFYVRGRAPGPVRLTLLVDASTAYFSGAVPANVALGVSSGRRDARLPTSIAARGQTVLKALGIDGQMPLARGLARLVDHFRRYRAGPPAGTHDDIYLDLALGGVGVCRHRAFAFAITARAAGLPTRLVHNEAHAFVEIRLPAGDWRRIDLGGQAPSLDLSGAENKRLHGPAPDAFPKPPAYTAQYSAQLMAQARAAMNAGGAAGEGDAAGEGTEGGTNADLPAENAPGPAPSEDVSAMTQGGVEAIPLPESGGAEAASFSAEDGGPPGAEALVAVQVRLAMDAGQKVAFRGEASPFAVAGRVVDAQGGEGVTGLEVQVHLVPLEDGPSVPLSPVGETVSGGHFSIDIEVPGTLPLGEYRIVVASRSRGRFAGGRSDRQSASP